MDEKRQDNQLEPIYNSSVPIQDVPGSTDVLVTRLDDDEIICLNKAKECIMPYYLPVTEGKMID